MLLTDNELVYINVGGMQRARLGEIAKVARENGELVISSTDRPLIRGAIKADKETLANFFSQVRQVAAWSRERRTVIMDSPSATPMDSSFVGRTPDGLVRPDLPDPIAEMPVPVATRPVVMVAPIESLPPLLSRPDPTQSLGRGVPPVPRISDENLIAQDRPRVVASVAPRFSETRSEPVRLEYAGFWVRFGAYFIDLIVLGLASGVLSFVFSSGDAASGLGLASFANLIFTWLYFAFLESGERQGTLGKMALGLTVTDMNQQRISFLHATGRYLARAIPAVVIVFGAFLTLGAAALASALSFSNSGSVRATLAPLVGGAFLALLLLLVTYLMAAFTAKKQALHDLIARTLVLKK